MSTAPWRFTPKEVKRAKKALTESGLEIAAVIFEKMFRAGPNARGELALDPRRCNWPRGIRFVPDNSEY
jgi:hypothetical protein